MIQGEIKIRLKDRFKEHRRPADKPTNISKPTMVSEHFFTDHHTANVISLISSELFTPTARACAKLIKRGNKLQPLGLNKRDEM